MIFYILLYGEFLKNFAEGVRDIVRFFSPFLLPLGTFLSTILNAIASVLPYGNLALYIVLLIVLIVLGMIINIKWPSGEKEITTERKKLYGIGYSLDNALDKRKDEQQEEQP